MEYCPYVNPPLNTFKIQIYLSVHTTVLQRTALKATYQSAAVIVTYGCSTTGYITCFNAVPPPQMCIEKTPIYMSDPKVMKLNSKLLMDFNGNKIGS